MSSDRPAQHFVSTGFGKVVERGEWLQFLLKLNRILNEMLATDAQIYYNPNWPTTEEKEELARLTEGGGADIGTGTDNHVARFDGTGEPVIQDSDVSIDDSGHVLPDADNAQNLGSSSFNWQELFARVIESQAALTLQAATNIALQSTAGDVTAGVSATKKFAVSVDSTEILNSYKSGGVLFIGTLDAVRQWSGVGSAPGTPASGFIYAYKLDATANEIYVKGENGIERRWTPPLSNYAASAAPTVNDDVTLGYEVGSNWYDTTADDAYVCLDGTDGAAVWKKTTP